MVSATAEELAEEVLDQVTEGAVESAEGDEAAVTIGFWHVGRSPERRARSITGAPLDVDPRATTPVAPRRPSTGS